MRLWNIRRFLMKDGRGKNINGKRWNGFRIIGTSMRMTLQICLLRQLRKLLIYCHLWTIFRERWWFSTHRMIQKRYGQCFSIFMMNPKMWQSVYCSSNLRHRTCVTDHLRDISIISVLWRLRYICVWSIRRNMIYSNIPYVRQPEFIWKIILHQPRGIQSRILKEIQNWLARCSQ